MPEQGFFWWHLGLKNSSQKLGAIGLPNILRIANQFYMGICMGKPFSLHFEFCNFQFWLNIKINTIASKFRKFCTKNTLIPVLKTLYVLSGAGFSIFIHFLCKHSCIRFKSLVENEIHINTNVKSLVFSCKFPYKIKMQCAKCRLIQSLPNFGRLLRDLKGTETPLFWKIGFVEPL